MYSRTHSGSNWAWPLELAGRALPPRGCGVPCFLLVSLMQGNITMPSDKAAIR